MLETLLKIGQWQSQGKSEWDRFLEYPKADKEDKRGNSQINYTLPIVFDLDKNEVIIESNNLKEYEENEVEKALGIKMKGSNSKAICAAGISKRLGRISQTFFGKEGEETDKGELYDAIEKESPNLLTQNFVRLLSQIFDLKEQFLEQTSYQTPSKTEVDIRAIESTFDLNPNENIVFLTVQVKAEDFGYDKPHSFSEIPEYEKFLEVTYFGSKDKKKQNTKKQKLCYASGEISDEVKELNLSNRYSLNKMFVTETKNYASVFDKNKFGLNYQVSAENQEYLDYASNYLLNQGYKVRIANLDHVIIPQFLHKSSVDLEMALEGIQRKSDLLFNLKKLDALNKNIRDWLEQDDEVFWINFIAFESDGNFFKSTEVIKDVSTFHLDKLLLSFYEINKRFQKYDFVNWEAVMTDYGEPRNLNFNSLYPIIPLRKDKEKKNKALDLFKTILENRKVHQDVLYEYFTELILCHYYSRYNSYTNVKSYGKDFFYFAVRDSVFKYLAFFELLKELNLIDMEETNTNTEEVNQYDKVENDFFHKMNYNQEQRAMFYLGRMLNSVEYLQQGKNKTVVQKVNFNGMDKDSIQRLRIDLIEKAKQYNAMNKVVFTDQKFGKEFDFNNWSLNPQEAIFFMLTGYSFGAGKKNESNTINE